MSAPRCDAVDWMKAIGISLIVYGHVAHRTTVWWVPPIYVKQFGVAFFLFAAGFTLGRERRRPVDAILSRLLPIYFYGLVTAAIISIIGVANGSGAALSNYLPFLAGANVVFDNFPANPTTWFFGTYIHALALWVCWLSRTRLGLRAVAVALIVEIPSRLLLLAWCGRYVAYMALTNWLAVFVTGLVIGRTGLRDVRGRAPVFAAALAGVVAMLSIAGAALNPTPSFPFMTFGDAPASLAILSAFVSTFYLAATLLLFKAVEHLPAPWLVGQLARHSLLIVLWHMPLFLFINPVLARWGVPYSGRVALELALCLPLLAALSAVVMASVTPKMLAGRAARLSSRAGRLAMHWSLPVGGSR